MAAAHPFGAFVGCQFKRIRCVRRIKVDVESASSVFQLKGRSSS